MSEQAVLLSQIRKIYDDSGGRYGSPRVYQASRREGVTVGENRVAKVMQQWGMRARAVSTGAWRGAVMS
ncbi:IS3 family transposase [Chromohalobacter canadensis]|uniref:IS3 family transposase n=1 Tax=Chromohalobacter canadensis TaxID=141389 RepID=UPI000BE3C036